MPAGLILSDSTPTTRAAVFFRAWIISWTRLTNPPARQVVPLRHGLPAQSLQRQQLVSPDDLVRSFSDVSVDVYRCSRHDVPHRLVVEMPAVNERPAHGINELLQCSSVEERERGGGETKQQSATSSQRRFKIAYT